MDINKPVVFGLGKPPGVKIRLASTQNDEKFDKDVALVSTVYQDEVQQGHKILVAHTGSENVIHDNPDNSFNDDVEDQLLENDFSNVRYSLSPVPQLESQENMKSNCMPDNLCFENGKKDPKKILKHKKVKAKVAINVKSTKKQKLREQEADITKKFRETIIVKETHDGHKSFQCNVCQVRYHSVLSKYLSSDIYPKTC